MVRSRIRGRVAGASSLLFFMIRNTVKTLSSKAAAQLDQELMSTGAFSIDQLMELAGLAVAKAVYHEYPLSPRTVSSPNKVLVMVGPGNNGGDGLVAARHLKLWGNHEPIIYYPKKSTKNQLYMNLSNQLKDLDIAEINDFEQIKPLLQSNTIKVILDSLFGFSFKPPIRSPFDEILKYLAENNDVIAPIVSVDIPSGWDVDEGPVDVDINPKVLVSLTAPKPCARFFNKEDKVHYLGGRFINDKIAKKYDIDALMGLYKNDDLIVKL